MRDQIYKDRHTKIADFAFDQSVVEVFPDMIGRSIPGYETLISISGLLVTKDLAADGRVYDLGCSLGASTQVILDQCPHKDIEIIAVDNSKEMINQAKQNIKDTRVNFVLEDVLNVPIHSANAVVCNFILQFLAKDQRVAFLEKIFQGMESGATLIVSEKIDSPEYISTHEDWKKTKGYSDLEIEQKRSALEKVMLIDSESDHLQRFKSVGFTEIAQWYRCLNWASYLLRK